MAGPCGRRGGARGEKPAEGGEPRATGIHEWMEESDTGGSSCRGKG